MRFSNDVYVHTARRKLDSYDPPAVEVLDVVERGSSPDGSGQEGCWVECRLFVTDEEADTYIVGGGE